MGEWILIWTLFCKADMDPECKYYHKSYLTFSECVEMLVEKDHLLSYGMDYYVPHVIYCTDDTKYRDKVRAHNRKYFLRHLIE